MRQIDKIRYVMERDNFKRILSDFFIKRFVGSDVDKYLNDHTFHATKKLEASTASQYGNEAIEQLLNFLEDK